MKGIGSTLKWDPDKSEHLFDALRRDEPLSTRPSADAALRVPVDPKQIRVQVENGTRTPGLGRRVDAALAATGFATTQAPVNGPPGPPAHGRRLRPPLGPLREVPRGGPPRQRTPPGEGPGPHPEGHRGHGLRKGPQGPPEGPGPRGVRGRPRRRGQLRQLTSARAEAVLESSGPRSHTANRPPSPAARPFRPTPGPAYLRGGVADTRASGWAAGGAVNAVGVTRPAAEPRTPTGGPAGHSGLLTRPDLRRDGPTGQTGLTPAPAGAGFQRRRTLGRPGRHQARRVRGRCRRHPGRGPLGGRRTAQPATESADRRQPGRDPAREPSAYPAGVTLGVSVGATESGTRGRARERCSSRGGGVAPREFGR